MQSLLTDTLKKFKNKADYLEIRVEESEGTSISFRGKEIENVSQPSIKGGCVRVLAKGGWGFVSFNNLSDLNKKVEMAVSQAKLVGSEKSQLAEVKPVVDKVKVKFKKDPRKISLAKKVNLMKEYHELIWSVNPKICDTKISYSDGISKVHFASSEGSYIEQEFSDVAGGFSAIARKGDLVQFTGFSVSDPADFSIIENLHKKVKERSGMAVKLLKASPIKAGNYIVILHPRLAGDLIHEAFGHLSEADHVYENPGLKKIMVLGRKIGVENLNVVDDPTLKGYRGSYKYDDEGVEASRTYLIKNGILTGRLHSRETAAKMGEKVTGNARAASYNNGPLVRMSNTFVEAGNAEFEEMIKDIKLGVYAYDSLGGNTDREMFTFAAMWGYMIRDGKLAELVRDVKLTGNLFATLKNIEAIGNDLKIEKGWSACGKGGQWIPIAAGGPHLRIKNITIGGQ